MIASLEVQVHTLENGLTVYLCPNSEEPRIAARVMVRAGAAADPTDGSGTAHLLEHMLANKGTARLGALDHEAEKVLLDRIDRLFDELARDPDNPEVVQRIDTLSVQAAPLAVPNELKQAYGRLGARGLNAYTSHDRTAYVVDLPAGALDAWIALESDRFRHPVLRAYQTEVETVREEKRRGFDDPGRSSREALNEMLWGEHPYGRTILGDLNYLAAPPPARMRAWYRRWYVPSNMALVLAGDLPPDAIDRIQQAFTWDEAPLPSLDVPQPNRPRGEQRREIQHSGPPSIVMGWRTVPHGHPDEDALAVADMLLSNGATGLLDLAEQTQQVRRAWSSPSFRRFGGAQTVGGSPRDGQTVEQVEALLLEAVRRLREGQVDPDRLSAIIQAWRIGELYGLERNAWRAAKLMQAFTYGESWEEVRQQTERRASVPLDAVVDAARRYFGEDRAVVVRRTGPPPLATLRPRNLTERPVTEGRNSAFFHDVLKRQAPPTPKPALVQGRDYHLRDGAIVADNPFSELAAVRYRIARGQGHDPALGMAMGLWDHAGVRGGDLSDWERHLYGQGSSVEVSSRRWSTTITLRGPRDRIPALHAEVMERLRRPELGDSERQKWLDDVLKRRHQSRETKSTRDGALKAYAAWGRRSPWLTEPIEETLVDQSLPDWMARVGHLLALKADTLAIGLTDVPAWPGANEPPERPARRAHRPSHDRILLLHHPMAQAQLTALTWDEDYRVDRVPLYTLTSELIGGSAGLFFQELREARGLAYSAQGRLERGALPGDDNLVVARVATTPEKAANTASLLLRLLREVPVDPARFHRAHASALTKMVGATTPFRQVPTTVLSWRLRGLDADPRPGWIQALGQLDLPRWRAYADRWRNRPITLAVLGDLSRVDRSALKALGDCVELDFSEISVR